MLLPATTEEEIAFAATEEEEEEENEIEEEEEGFRGGLRSAFFKEGWEDWKEAVKVFM